MLSRVPELRILRPEDPPWLSEKSDCESPKFEKSEFAVYEYLPVVWGKCVLLAEDPPWLSGRSDCESPKLEKSEFAVFEHLPVV